MAARRDLPRRFQECPPWTGRGVSVALPWGRIHRLRSGCRPDELPQIGKSLLDLRRIDLRRPRLLAGGCALAGRSCGPLGGFTGCLLERHRAFARRRGFLFERHGPLSHRNLERDCPAPRRPLLERRGPSLPL